MVPFPVVIFDFDYTLADSSRGALECCNYAFKRMDLPHVSAEAACKTIGMSLPNTLISLAGEEYEERSDEFASLFIRRADEVMADLTVVFKDAPRVITHLKGRGISLGIVSTKFRYRIEAILGRENLLDLFDVIVGGEDVSKHKPDQEGLMMAIERLGGSRTTSLYVGDSVTDAETARRARVSFVVVLSGVTPREAFVDYSVYRILDNLYALTKLF